MPAVSATNGINGHANGVANPTPAHPLFDSIPDVIQAFANDEFVIVLDDTSRENEGDLIIAASALTPAKASFMIRYSSGYICAPLSVSRAAALHLPQMVADNADPNRTAYAVSIDAEDPSVSTGISAHDRSLTCRMLADPSAKASHFRRPGHVLPLQARDGGVRVRRGHTEAAVDLCRLAGKQPVGVICELITDGEETEGKPELVGGGMMRRDECLAFGNKWGIKVCTIEDLVAYIEANEGKLPSSSK
ncbi:3,4-dihydroxy-2-butanone 4-phosphate synthase [Cucurbitaria berberidis CBS 394.84]|uniref:3,4-dihydroxy-2-butanone 4-phosphate synthase n=1 Tax=Cucurbitaria berberidis CBS 394.84 TaxID=1168544 RepID=A0A9P4L7S4_9PLEO|nr:3,4-dihydroxy-2-butanone 4-phosphate synthase [Cucurbitaria berberidis CBS 394.84]KAF1845285.1 3,4-dihydroxy-2-butanone 4-phosphate synthase [Cucurbitaria berberidis CBS 394.84]